MKVSEAYDLYLMDVHMPVKDGFEACREIRKMEGNKTRTPHSVYRIAGGRCMGVDSEAGIDDYLTKPFKAGELYKKLKKYASDNLFEKVA